MDFHLLADVRETAGPKLGELRHVVCDPGTRQVHSIVVKPSAADVGAVVVPIDAVDAADDDAVYLSLDEEEFTGLERYAFARNIAPPPAEYDPRNPSADEEQEPIDVPDVPPVGAAEGITSIAYTPILEVQRNIPDADVVLDDTTTVHATDGDLGRVEHVLVSDDSLQVTGLIVEKGLLVQRSLEIPVEWVADMAPGLVVLNVDRRAVETAQTE